MKTLTHCPDREVANLDPEAHIWKQDLRWETEEVRRQGILQRIILF